MLYLTVFDKPGRLSWGLIVLATIMGMIFSVGISQIQFYILAHTLPNFLVTMLEDGNVINTSNVYMTIFTFISACVLAPIMEEVIFRDFSYSEWLINVELKSCNYIFNYFWPRTF